MNCVDFTNYGNQIALLSVVEQFKAVVMVAGVVDQPVVGKDDPLRTPGLGVEGVDVALGPAAARGLRQQALPVAKTVPADAHTGQYIIQATAFPAGGAGLLLGDKIAGKMAVGVDIA